MFHNIVRDKVTNKTVSTDHNLSRERRSEADSNRGPSAYQPNALPLGQTGSHVIPLKNFAFTTSLGVSSSLPTHRSFEVQFKMVYLCARKSPHALHPLSQKIPKVAFQTISMFVICHIQFAELARVCVCITQCHSHGTGKKGLLLLSLQATYKRSAWPDQRGLEKTVTHTVLTGALVSCPEAVLRKLTHHLPRNSHRNV